MTYFNLSNASLLALTVLGAVACADPGDPVLVPDAGSTGGSASTTSAPASTTSTPANTTSAPVSTTSTPASTTSAASGGASSTTGSAVSTTSSSLDGGAGTTGGDVGEEPMMSEDPFAGLFGDGGLLGGGEEPTEDGGFTPPPEGAGTWKLNPDSAAECPEEPPPIPIIGGACLGIYYGCGWTNEEGTVYSCICDWIHWLCI